MGQVLQKLLLRHTGTEWIVLETGLLILGLFNDDFLLHRSHCANDRIFEKDVEGSGRGLF